MDLLEDLLQHSGLKSRFIGYRTFSDAAAIQFPCGKSIGFHVVTHGQAFIHHDPKLKPIVLNKGDIALMARGCDHIVSTQEKRTHQFISLSEFDRRLQSKGPSQLTLVSGAYQLWNQPIHPFFDEIPDWFVLKSEDLQTFDNLQISIRLLSEEVAKPELGSDRIVQGLLDVMFSFIMRRIVQKTSSKAKTWSHAVQNIQVKKAIELMHSDCSKSWSLDELAKKVGLSRAGFALKFKKILGDTPLHYLTTLRIQKAMDLLTSTDRNIESIALDVGYQDAFSFSKVFKKMTGLPPRDFRNQELSERKIGWKF
jgi:AraC-like DNA-binding protein